MASSSIRILTFQAAADVVERFRVHIPVESAKILAKFEKSVKSLRFCEDRFGIELHSGVFVCLMNLTDSYPQDYVSALGLAQGLRVVDEGQYSRYAFKTAPLLNALDLANSVLGEDNSFVTMKLVGHEPDTGFPVWDLGGKSYNTCSVSEKVACFEEGPSGGVSFSVNRKDCANVLKTYGDDVIIFNRNDRPLVCSDREGLDITLLLKTV